MSSEVPFAEFPLFISHPPEEEFPASAVVQCFVRALDVVVLPINNGRTEAWSLPVYTLKENNTTWDALDVRDLFPGGYYSVLLARDPGTNDPLPHQYRVYVDNCHSCRPLNKSIQETLCSNWVGNVVVAKYSKSSSMNRRSFAHVSRGEADLLVHLTVKYLKVIWNTLTRKTGMA